MRLCIIGNSHIGSIRRAWPSPDAPGVEVTFFGVGIKQLRRLKQKGTRIVPSDEVARNAFLHTSRGLSAIDFLEYDAFLFVGGGFGLPTASRIFRGHKLSPDEGPCDAQIISEEFAVASLVDALANSTLLKLARSAVAVTQAPVVLAPEPLPNVRIKALEISWWWGSEQAREVLRRGYQLGLNKIGAEISVSPQPAKTIVDGLFTAEKFTLKPGSSVDRVMSTGSARVPENGDMFHMNAKYGSRILIAALAKIEELTGKRVAAES